MVFERQVVVSGMHDLVAVQAELREAVQCRSKRSRFLPVQQGAQLGAEVSSSGSKETISVRAEYQSLATSKRYRR